ncbi:MAG: insulinase family protein [Thermodesulfobacteriota bacterium]|nr:insulinase family protein [Thermodesulfobacteriota bacterium]
MTDNNKVPAIQYREGAVLSGYHVTQCIPFEEIHAVLYVLEHEATGARHIHIASKDIENTFGVAFKTIPEDSTGVAHILEHTILCGSERYPVRDPFFSMIKRSLSSFMNALTASDWTMYPFATPNPKDFYNLMDVYLDAVFYPRLSELSFKQEGHRLEFVPAFDKGGNDGELVYKGVVFNEMKGAMSSPDQIMNRFMMHALCPDTTYGNNSGGDPAVIPSLTHEQLKMFHGRFYHPSNAYFYTYGNLPLERHLAFIEEKVLSRFSRIDPGSDVPSQPRWRAPRTVATQYPISEDEDPARKHQCCVAWLTADTCDSYEVFSLIVLEQVLLGNQASPMRKALIESGLGSALSDGTGFESDIKDTVFAFGLKDVRKEDVGKIESIIFETLEDLATNGIDKALVDASIHQIEFHRREITNTPYPYGIKLLLTMAGSWLHGVEPAEIIQIEPYVNWLFKKMAAGPFLEDQIKKYFLDNPHRILFTLEPDKTLAERENQQEASTLARIRDSLTPADIEKIKTDAASLERLQMEEEDLSVLPTLELTDISPDIQTTQGASPHPFLYCYEQPTSGIFYYTAAAGTGVLPADLLPLVPFFCIALPRMGTQTRDYVELSRFLDMHTGGVGLSAQARTEHTESGSCVPYVSFFGKSLSRKQDKLFEIINELISQPAFSNMARLGQLLGEYRASLESSVIQNGHRLAISLASRGFSQSAALGETWHGIHQLTYIKEITADLNDDKLAAIAKDLAAIAGTLFQKDNLKTGLIGEPEDIAKAVTFAETLNRNLKQSQSREDFGAANVNTADKPLREGWHTATAVSFVASAFPTVRMAHADAPAMSVISKLLRSSFLHREIREKGGAYGGFSLYNPEEGRFCFASYRDPHIVQTLDVYERAVGYLQSGDYTDEMIKESILQVCSDIDRPDTPAERGTRAFHRQLLSLTDDQRRRFKAGVLAVTRDTVMKAAKAHFPTDTAQLATAVISSRDALETANETLTPEDLSLHKI